MKWRRLLSLVVTNLRASRFNTLLSVVGVAVGIALLTFFVGLGHGLRARVLNRIAPATQIELEPRRVRLFGIEEAVGQVPLDDVQLARLSQLPGVVRVVGRQKSAFAAKLWGGKQLLGYDLRAEAFFDGIPPSLLQDELQSTEQAAAPSIHSELSNGARCDVDLDCTAGSSCNAGRCQPIVWAQHFDDGDLVLRCEGGDGCGPGRTCVKGRCVSSCGQVAGGGVGGRFGACAAAHVCHRSRCRIDDDCALGRCRENLCEVGGCVATCRSQDDCRAWERCDASETTGQCLAQRCILADGADAYRVDPERGRGHRASRCNEPLGWCATAERCPPSSYCSTDYAGSTLGYCERPVPTVLNPLLLELFNSDMASALGLARMASAELLYGIHYHLALGDSFFTKDQPRRDQRIRQAVVVGVSRTAPELGVTVPLAWVRHHNTRYIGRDRTHSYDAVVIEVSGNEVGPETIAAAEKHGLSLSRRSRITRTLGTVAMLMWLALLLLAAVVLASASMNMAQLLAMLVHERRHELAILRAIGASARDIAALVLGEALLLAVGGGVVGYVAARLLAGLVDLVSAQFLAGIPLAPSSFFLFPWWMAPAAIAVAVGCCLLGAVLPARRAVRLDPAAVLSQP